MDAQQGEVVGEEEDFRCSYLVVAEPCERVRRREREFLRLLTRNRSLVLPIWRVVAVPSAAMLD